MRARIKIVDCYSILAHTLRLSMAYAIDFSAVALAAKRIAGTVHCTPIVTSCTVNTLTGLEVFFKAENLQKTGAFKIRGALNAVKHLKETCPTAKGVVTHSSGNHGQALSYAASVAGLPCTVVVPKNAPEVKARAIQSYGAEVVFCEPTPQAREETCAQLALDKGYMIIPPYDHPDVMAGQGTIAMELLEQVDNLDAILIPVSGGGLSSGIAVAAKHLRPGIRIFLVEPAGKGLEKCLQAGERVWPNPPQMMKTIADGLRIQQVGRYTWPVLCDLAEKTTVAMDDNEIVAAMKFTFERLKLVVEPSGAAAVAAILSEKFSTIAKQHNLKRVAVVISGGNVDLSSLPW